MVKTYLERLNETQKEIDELVPEMIALRAKVNEQFDVVNDQLDKLIHDLEEYISSSEKMLDDYQSSLDTNEILDKVARNGYVTVIKF